MDVEEVQENIEEDEAQNIPEFAPLSVEGLVSVPFFLSLRYLLNLFLEIRPEKLSIERFAFRLIVTLHFVTTGKS